jgi:hypothetical protein
MIYCYPLALFFAVRASLNDMRQLINQSVELSFNLCKNLIIAITQ